MNFTILAEDIMGIMTMHLFIILFYEILSQCDHIGLKQGHEPLNQGS